MSSHMSGSASGWEEALVEHNDFEYPYPQFEKDLCFFDKPDRNVLVEQLARAMLYDEAVDIWAEAVELFRAKKHELQEMALWETFCEDLLRQREGTSSGGMSEAAKRPRSHGEAREPHVPAEAPVFGMATPPSSTTTPCGQSTRSSDATRGTTSATRSSGSTMGKTSTMRTSGSMPLAGVLAVPPDDDDESLPIGITSLRQWGQTVIRFGKYKSKDITYSQLSQLGDREAHSYRSWAMARVGSGGAQLVDLAKYLLRLKSRGNLPPPPESPTTSTPGQQTFQRELRRPGV